MKRVGLADLRSLNCSIVYIRRTKQGARRRTTTDDYGRKLIARACLILRFSHGKLNFKVEVYYPPPLTPPHTLVNTSKSLHLNFDQNLTTLFCTMILETVTTEYVWFEHPHCWSLLLAILNNKMLKIHMTHYILYFMKTHVKVSAVKMTSISLHYW